MNFEWNVIVSEDCDIDFAEQSFLVLARQYEDGCASCFQAIHNAWTKVKFDKMTSSASSSTSGRSSTKYQPSLLKDMNLKPTQYGKLRTSLRYFQKMFSCVIFYFFLSFSFVNLLHFICFVYLSLTPSPKKNVSECPTTTSDSKHINIELDLRQESSGEMSATSDDFLQQVDTMDVTPQKKFSILAPVHLTQKTELFLDFSIFKAISAQPRLKAKCSSTSSDEYGAFWKTAPNAIIRTRATNQAFDRKNAKNTSTTKARSLSTVLVTNFNCKPKRPRPSTIVQFLSFVFICGFQNWLGCCSVFKM